MSPVSTFSPPQFADLLARALTEPGIVSTAYTAFHGYSIGNQILALVQCAERGITPGPISTFMGWKDKGRYVRKGEKAIVLCMPITAKRRAKDDQPVNDVGHRRLRGASDARGHGPFWHEPERAEHSADFKLTHYRRLERLVPAWQSMPRQCPIGATIAAAVV